VAAAATAYLAPSRAVTVVLGDAERIAGPLAALAAVSPAAVPAAVSPAAVPAAVSPAAVPAVAGGAG
jgi:hypothetical protein